MTEADARLILLSFTGSFESSHHGHPDFRNIKGIFASFQPDKDLAVLRLPLELGEEICISDPKSRRVVSRFGGVAWVSFALGATTLVDFEPLANLAFEARLR